MFEIAAVLAGTLPADQSEGTNVAAKLASALQATMLRLEAVYLPLHAYRLDFHSLASWLGALFCFAFRAFALTLMLQAHYFPGCCCSICCICCSAWLESSAKRMPTRAECFMNFSQHFCTHCAYTECFLAVNPYGCQATTSRDSSARAAVYVRAPAAASHHRASGSDWADMYGRLSMQGRTICVHVK